MIGMSHFVAPFLAAYQGRFKPQCQSPSDDKKENGQQQKIYISKYREKGNYVEIMRGNCTLSSTAKYAMNTQNIVTHKYSRTRIREYPGEQKIIPLSEVFP